VPTEYVRVEGIKPTLSALRKMPKAFKIAATDASQKIADTEAQKIKANASTRQERLAAQSVRARRGQAPSIAAGGAMRVRSRTKSIRAGDVFFGAEFGGRGRPTTQQFPAYRGRVGYFFWPTIRADSQAITRQWETALDALAKTWDDHGVSV
jgi:hypothetical protein